MSPKLTPRQAAEIRALAAEGGLTHAEIASRYGVSRSAVTRVVGQTRQVPLPALDEGSGYVSEAVDTFLGELELEGADAIRARTARALAAQLDACTDSGTAAAAAASPRLAERLLAVIDALDGRDQPEGINVARLLREVLVDR